ncbi:MULTISPECIES: response regulator transcription factor [unclassified Rathayibacter]|uniref:response regulator n=1 Tax=unclassified Rathayibacter TaxID=2609250 RepID=UPI000F4B84CE|nr:MULTISPECIES: response regulator transcription factor [unclassified Rathayibacter]MCJ1683603.1 response regulator transcription factor [Rathayibacter sp. VKM Ac-2928]MCJ1704428.1 response regulator transcription factor [Rathayibacter sp. VKM Ac-2926]ROP43533.1 LuxR family two component transcriptional regulator [Rathayibacter sp. PhB186]ROS46817.1 LuxR family two component transcriptional regulator [Rathayibacter sp. PhB185]TCL81448.1 LuxR family two component transcriptional regulator [Rat
MIRVLIVDDHPLVRAGLAALISSAPDLLLVGQAGSGEEALGSAAESAPDVVLMDLSMPGMDGIEATARMLALHPAIRVVVLTSFDDRGRVLAALRAGAQGYQLKDADPAVVLDAVRSAAAGHAPLDPRAARALLPGGAGAALPALSTREEQVLRLIASGRANKEIARELGIAERTVKVHVGHAFTRIGVRDRTSAALWVRDHLPGY